MGGLAWSPDGREVWFAAAKVGSARALYAVTLDGRATAAEPRDRRPDAHDISRSGRVSSRILMAASTSWAGWRA